MCGKSGSEQWPLPWATRSFYQQKLLWELRENNKDKSNPPCQKSFQRSIYDLKMVWSFGELVCESWVATLDSWAAVHKTWVARGSNRGTRGSSQGPPRLESGEPPESASELLTLVAVSPYYPKVWIEWIQKMIERMDWHFFFLLFFLHMLTTSLPLRDQCLSQ